MRRASARLTSPGQVFGLLSLAIEWPLGVFEYSRIRRSFPTLIGLYVFMAFTGCAYAPISTLGSRPRTSAVLVYQSTNATLYYLIACAFYFRAHSLGESRPVAPAPGTASGLNSV
jgi:hypothetical protein